MSEGQQPLQEEELRRIVAKRDSAVTVVFLAALIAIFGALLRPFPALSLAMVAIAPLVAFAFWARYVFLSCPRCEARFHSTWSILFGFGLPQARRCCHCGVQAPVGPASHGT